MRNEIEQQIIQKQSQESNHEEPSEPNESSIADKQQKARGKTKKKGTKDKDFKKSKAKKKVNRDRKEKGLDTQQESGEGKISQGTATSESEDTTKEVIDVESTVKSPNSILKTSASYAATVQKKQGPILPQYRPYRIIVQFKIKKPGNKAKRTEMICKKLNSFLQVAKEVNYKQRIVYVRKFKEFHPPQDTDKNEWISEFNGKLITSLTNYTHGFFAGQELREGTFRLKLQLILPIQLEIETFAENADGAFNTKDDRRVYHCQEQQLYDPQTVGWFLRSSWHMTGSDDLLKALENKVRRECSAVTIGLSFKTVSPPTKQKYDKETAVKAIVISTNAIHVSTVNKVLFKIYNSKNTEFPLDIPFHYVPHKDNPDVKSNPVAALNITTLMERQRIFIKNTRTVPCSALADVDRIAKKNLSLRKILTKLASIHGDKDKKTPKARLFHALCRRVEKGGESTFYLTYHVMLEVEARSIIDNMGAFVRDELKLDPDLFCHPTSIQEDHTWDPITRVCNNPTVSFLDSLVEKTGGLIGSDPDDENEDGESMNSKEKREYNRTVGIDDTETVKDLNQKKEKKTKPPKEVDRDDQSCRSEMSALTLYSSDSKASQQRKKLRAELDSTQVELEEKDAVLEAKEAALAEAMRYIEVLKQAAMGSPVHTSNGETHSDGEKEANEDNPPNGEKEEIDTQEPQDSEFLPDGTVDYQHSDDDRTIYVDDQERFPLDNPYGHETWKPEPNWVLRMIGEKTEVVTEAIQLHTKGYVIIISRTGAAENDLALYTEGNECFQGCYEDNDDYAETMEYEQHPPTDKDEAGVRFDPFKEVQYYHNDSNGLDGKNEERSLDGNQQESAQKDLPRKDSDSSGSESSSDSSDSSSEGSKSSEDSEPSSSSEDKSSSQSSGVSTSSKEQSSKDSDISYASPDKSTQKRKPNLTKNTFDEAKQVVEQEADNQTSGGDPGNPD